MRKYDKLGLGREISTLFPYYQPFLKNWPWLAQGQPAPVDFEAALKEMCWMIYEKTSTDRGLQVMGREWDTDPYAMDAHMMGRVQAAAQGDGFVGFAKDGVQPFGKTWGTNWERLSKGNHKQSARWGVRTQEPTAPMVNYSPGARGNVLKMDRWHPTMNDCWVLGGVHRSAIFRLVSPRTPDNIWNVSQGFFVVTARELLGLMHYGYTPQRTGAEVCLVPPDTVSELATITNYWHFILVKSTDTTGEGVSKTIRNLLDLEAKSALHDQVRAGHKLKHTVDEDGVTTREAAPDFGEEAKIQSRI